VGLPLAAAVVAATNFSSQQLEAVSVADLP